MSSAMPVVWCTDPNSTNKKPTAFALQGIQLQGNLSEQHVLAVRELINAASEGRLLLPTDGGIVLLDCGVGVGSVIIQDSNNQIPINKRDESNKENEGLPPESQSNVKERISDTTLQETKSEMLYEFLCCARCMTEGTKCHNRNTQKSKIMEKYRDAKLSTGRAGKRPGNVIRPTVRRKNTVAFKSDKRPVQRRAVSSGNGNKIPIYATVNKHQKQKNRLQRQREINQQEHCEKSDPVLHDNGTSDAIDLSPTLNGAAGRKTSFDSTCTVSSMDSGFMEMQNKLEIAKNLIKSQKTDEVQIRIDAAEETDMVDSAVQSNWNRLTVPQTSRNRRKSYEEFKLLFCDQQKSGHQSLMDQRMDSAKASIKSRRKSYEEFKSVTSTICDTNSKSASSSNTNDIVIKNNLSTATPVTTTTTTDETSGSFFAKMKRKNSKRMSTKKTKFNNQTVNQKIDEDVRHDTVISSTIYDILRKNSTSNVTDANKAKTNYDKNLELFKRSCGNNLQDFDNLLSCGTIYDIIQRKSDIYTKNFKRYDKYMTYGTLYEILHRKTDEGDEFERKRTLSEKFTNKRINYAHIAPFKAPCPKSTNDGNVSASDMLDLNSANNITSVNSMKQGSGSANNQLSITSTGSKQLSTIYDILQTKKMESNANSVAIAANNGMNAASKNRFLVRKITEEDLIDSQKDNHEETIVGDEKKLNLEDNQLSDQQAKKQARIRRFSNILSYTPKLLNESDKINLKFDSEKKLNNILEAKIDELYSRLNRIHQQNSDIDQRIQKIIEEPPKMFKSSSLDMLSTLNENETLIVKQRPLRKISVPVHQPLKVPPKKSTRRLSEFTRGEFLNEKQ